jgi:subtilisin family serine protease
MSFVLDPDDHIEALLHKIRTMIGGIDAHGAPDPINGKRFLFVAAAGNLDSCRETHLVTLAPAVWGRATPGLITVGGAGLKGAWAGGCGGEGVEMLAPAENIVSAFHTAPDDYRAARSGRSGTSWSAAIVSGMAARILSKDKTLTPEQLEAKLVH